MKVLINEIVFKQMIDSVKHCVAGNDNRPRLRFIKIVVKGETVTAYALDGFRAAKTQIKVGAPAEENFECYIKPFPFKPLKAGINPVVIEFDGERAFVEVVTEFGKVRYSFTQCESWGDLPESVYETAKIHDREVGMNSGYMAQACRALAGIADDSTRTVVLETKENNIQPFILRASGNGITSEQLILPVRLSEELNEQYK